MKERKKERKKRKKKRNECGRSERSLANGVCTGQGKRRHRRFAMETRPLRNRSAHVIDRSVATCPSQGNVIHSRNEVNRRRNVFSCVPIEAPKDS